MKIRNGFVSNSSSTAFIITNLTNEEKNLVDFVNETPHLIEEFNSYYQYKYTQEELLKSAEENNIYFSPNEQKDVVFGDEDGTLIGQIYDYILRDGVDSPSFKVRFLEMLR
jgi:hypothetical protein